MVKTWTVQAIRESIDPDKEIIIAIDEYIRVDEIEPPHKLKMLFKKAGNRYVEIDLAKTVKAITDKLEPHVDVKRFLKELILLHSSAEEIVELKDRLEKGYAKISEAPRCYALMVGGKRGRPWEFNLVG